MDEITTEPLTAEQADSATAVLAEAFFRDPVMSWLLPAEPRRKEALEKFLALETAHVLRHPDSLVATRRGTARGVLLVLPPRRWKTPFLSEVRHARTYASIFGIRLGRANALQSRLNRLHPREPHYFIPMIGVATTAQGTGIGSLLLEQLTARADAEGLPIYLEATSPDSARLYRRHGFVTKRTITGIGRKSKRGWPPIELMARMPQESGS
ncbi:MAG TPA: GNAT family N-acetyltransferase [Nocardioides sp.]|nr:GNAT family N-acetyltransferase [Nocardioides sp.]